eukprot:scpid18041/ scgid26440/ MFS-type transporter SLC18B1; Solute carrier family 18 member B1
MEESCLSQSISSSLIPTPSYGSTEDTDHKLQTERPEGDSHDQHVTACTLTTSTSGGGTHSGTPHHDYHVASAAVRGNVTADNNSSSTGCSTPSASYSAALGLSRVRKRVIFVCLALNSTFTMACIAVMIPFFPRDASKKDPSGQDAVGGASAIGLVFSITPFTEFLAAPFVGKLIPQAGPKLVLLLGGVLVSGVMVLFGFVNDIDEWSDFLIICYALRGVQGVATAFNATAAFAVLVGLFPDNVSLVSGVIRASQGFGFTVGPAMAGALYDYGGFMLPFLVHGSVMFAGTIWVLFALPGDVEVATSKKGKKMFSDILTMPWSLLWLTSIFVWGSGIGMIEPTLSLFLEEHFGLSASKVGLIFLLYAGTLAVSSPVVGYVADNYIAPHWFQPLGMALGVLGFALVGPWSGLSLVPAVWRTIVSLVCIGIGAGIISTCVTPGVLKAMHQAGYKDTLELHSSLGGMITAFFSSGLALGPTVGSIAASAIGFPNAAATFALPFLAAGGAGGLLKCWNKIAHAWQRRQCTDEHVVLISEQSRVSSDHSCPNQQPPEDR